MTDFTGLDTLVGLIDILKDEKRYGPVLAEMKAVREQTAIDLKKISEKATSVAQDRAAAMVAGEKMAAQHNEIHQRLLPREADVQKAAKILEEREAKVFARETDVTGREKVQANAFTTREAAVAAREKQQDDNEHALKVETARVADLRKELETKLGNLKKAVA